MSDSSGCDPRPGALAAALPRLADNYRAPEQNEGMNLLQPQNGNFSQVLSPERRLLPTKTSTLPTPAPEWHKMETKQDGKRLTVNNLQILHSYLPANTHAHFCFVFLAKPAHLGPKSLIQSEDRSCAKPIENVGLLRGETSE